MNKEIKEYLFDCIQKDINHLVENRLFNDKLHPFEEQNIKFGVQNFLESITDFRIDINDINVTKTMEGSELVVYLSKELEKKIRNLIK